MSSAPSSESLLVAATLGFDQLFANNVIDAKKVFESHITANDDKKEKESVAFHQLGLGVCVFLEAALGMEVRAITAVVTRTLLTNFRAQRWKRRPRF